MARQNSFQILLLKYDVKMIGEYKETKVKMLYGCPYERIHFLPKIYTNSGFGRDCLDMIMISYFILHVKGVRMHRINNEINFDQINHGLYFFAHYLGG